MSKIYYIIKKTFESAIKTASAEIHTSSMPYIPPTSPPTCYAPPAGIQVPSLFLANIILFLLAPIISIIIAILNGKKALKKEYFSIFYFIFTGFKSVLKVSIFYLILFFIIIFIFRLTHPYLLSYWKEGILLFFLIFVINSIFSGIVYLFFSFKNRKFLKIFPAFILVVPAIVIFLWVFLCSRVKELKDYLPKDHPKVKKDNLKDKFIKENKIEKNEEKE